MKRPSPVVWLANALAREHPEEVRAVLEAGGSVREAYGSGDVAAVREATQRRQQAVSAALRAARAILEKAGGSAASERRLATTLLGASIDPPQGRRLAAGRLENEIEPTALEGVFAEAPKLAAAKSAKRDSDDRAAEKETAARRKARETAIRAQRVETERAADRAVKAGKIAVEKREQAALAAKEAERADSDAKLANAAADEERKKLERLEREA